jgi:heme-degrading monooxygenase HmoA
VFHILWRFETSEAQANAFAAAYGPDGAWVAFFRQADGYRETELFRRQQSPPCYLTIDRWETRDAYERFRRDQAAAYAALDSECEGLTVAETFLAAWED